MNARAAATVAVLLALTVSGCFGGGGKKKDDPTVIPAEITEQDIQRLQDLTAADPTAFSFPGQKALPPASVWFNGTLASGTGSTGIELPNDEGPIDYGSEVVAFDLSSAVPVGQPVEVRANLKWWGDPGTSADLDIWADMPGASGAFDGPRFDESMNWNIINKQRVIDAVHVEGEPFSIGLQVSNGRILLPDGVRYQLEVQLNFVADVLAPGAAYAIQVPANATGIVMETERVVGDEHVAVQFVLVGPDDQLVVQVDHNDIGTETLFLPVRGAGEYVVYAQSMHGGFVRLETDVPNPTFEARLLQLDRQDRMLFEGPQPAPGTYAEQAVGTQRLGSNTFGATGSFDVGPTFPLDVRPILRATTPVDAAINITAPGGWLTTAYMTGSYADERGRIGAAPTELHDRSQLGVGTYGYGIVANGVGVALGVQVVSYQR